MLSNYLCALVPDLFDYLVPCESVHCVCMFMDCILNGLLKDSCIFNQWYIRLAMSAF